MSIKGKILSIISIFAIAIVLTFVGVWAVTDLDFSVGGNITYTAPVSGYDLTIKGQMSVLDSVNISINQEEFDSVPSLGTSTASMTWLFEDVLTVILQNNFSYDLTIICTVGEFPIASLTANSASSMIELTQNTTIYLNM